MATKETKPVLFADNEKGYQDTLTTCLCATLVLPVPWSGWGWLVSDSARTYIFVVIRLAVKKILGHVLGREVGRESPSASKRSAIYVSI